MILSMEDNFSKQPRVARLPLFMYEKAFSVIDESTYDKMKKMLLLS
jgi:hypothetical protein